MSQRLVDLHSVTSMEMTVTVDQKTCLALCHL